MQLLSCVESCMIKTVTINSKSIVNFISYNIIKYVSSPDDPAMVAGVLEPPGLLCIADSIFCHQMWFSSVYKVLPWNARSTPKNIDNSHKPYLRKSELSVVLNRQQEGVIIIQRDVNPPKYLLKDSIYGMELCSIWPSIE